MNRQYVKTDVVRVRRGCGRHVCEGGSGWWPHRRPSVRRPVRAMGGGAGVVGSGSLWSRVSRASAWGCVVVGSPRSTDEEPHDPPVWLLTCGFAGSWGSCGARSRRAITGCSASIWRIGTRLGCGSEQGRHRVTRLSGECRRLVVVLASSVGSVRWLGRPAEGALPWGSGCIARNYRSAADVRACCSRDCRPTVPAMKSVCGSYLPPSQTQKVLFGTTSS